MRKEDYKPIFNDSCNVVDYLLTAQQAADLLGYAKNYLNDKLAGKVIDYVSLKTKHYKLSDINKFIKLVTVKS